jgi:hypothetical protein
MVGAEGWDGVGRMSMVRGLDWEPGMGIWRSVTGVGLISGAGVMDIYDVVPWVLESCLGFLFRLEILSKKSLSVIES